MSARFVSLGGCDAHVDVHLVWEDFEPSEDHAFMCVHPAGHDGSHAALVTWLDGDE